MEEYIDPEIKWPEPLRFISGDFVRKFPFSCYYSLPGQGAYWVDQDRKINYSVTGYEVTGILTRYKYV